jgi:hypothetical protein
LWNKSMAPSRGTCTKINTTLKPLQEYVVRISFMRQECALYRNLFLWGEKIKCEKVIVRKSKNVCLSVGKNVRRRPCHCIKDLVLPAILPRELEWSHFKGWERRRSCRNREFEQGPVCHGAETLGCLYSPESRQHRATGFRWAHNTNKKFYSLGMADRNSVMSLHLPRHTTNLLSSIVDPVKDTTSNQFS